MYTAHELLIRAERLAPSITPENRLTYNAMIENLRKIKEQEDARQIAFMVADLLITALEANNN